LLPVARRIGRELKRLLPQSTAAVRYPALAAHAARREALPLLPKSCSRWPRRAEIDFSYPSRGG
jgi:hypothetical protein